LCRVTRLIFPSCHQRLIDYTRANMLLRAADGCKSVISGRSRMTSLTNTKDLKPIRPGPRKKHLKPRATKQQQRAGHKKRSVWFQARSSWPLREAPVQILVVERNRVKRDLPTPKGVAPWRCIGPTNIG